MNKPVPVISNADARRVFLDAHALAEAPTGPARGADLLALITRLGFVQVDSINIVERAHHMILFARRQAYKPKALQHLLERDRTLFEHWTHDASVIPTAFYGHWRHRFLRDEDRLRARWKDWRRDGFEEKFDEIMARVTRDGGCSSGDVGEGEKRGSGGWWDWHPSKTALEYLWRTGKLSVARREGFRKIYDLSERVVPVEYLRDQPDEATTIAWACGGALDRLGFANAAEIAAFWAKLRPGEVRDWCAAAEARGEIVAVEVEGADGARRAAYMRPDLLARSTPRVTGRLRVLSPFDPALRDRARAERLFGFHYRIEVFVPEARRIYGYYVFPLLEGDQLVGRIDMKADRKDGVLRVTALWPERGVKFGAGRMARLEAELNRVARFAGCESVQFLDGWRRDPM